MNNPALEETARSLMDAAQAMRQSAAQSGASATSAATSSLDRLEAARRELEDQRADRARRDTEEAMERVAELQSEQRQIQRDVRNMPTERGAERTRQIEQLQEQKTQMEAEVQQLERDLDQSASSARTDNPEAARGMSSAANMIRATELREKIRYSRNTVEQWDPESAVTLELNIEADIQAIRDQLEQANQVASNRRSDPLEEALDETRNLVRGMEAMNRRLNEPGQQGQDGQPGQQGQQGQGQQGQQGQGQQGQGQGQGQGDQQGQQGGGQIGGNNRGGGGDYNAGFNTGDYRNGGAPRQLSDEELRQYQSQIEQRADQIRDLRNDMSAMGRPIEDLDAVLESMARLDDRGVITDPRALAEIHQGMLDRLKRMEFGLRREVEGDTGRNPTLSGSDDVPDGYRPLVEDYFRALARGSTN
jgi:hypothetical protein